MSKVLVEDNIEISENIVVFELADYDVIVPCKQGVEMATMNLPDIIL
jgi:hypothetical protein